MRSWSVRARAPRGDLTTPPLISDPDILAAHLEDAAHFPGGHASGLVVPASEAEVAAALRASQQVLPIGAQSSLTGGATPMGGIVLSTAKLTAIESLADDLVRVQSGVTLVELDRVLAESGRYYPPIPTFTGAFVGGTVATNAAGAATFKYGMTRRWVQGLTVVLPGGDVLEIERGMVHAHPDGYFEIVTNQRTIRVPLPSYRMPDVVKLSAGYFAAPAMDLVDLFIGAEGTLGVITDVTLRVLPSRPAFCLALVPFKARTGAFEFVRLLRDEAARTWTSRDPRGIDVSGIEHMDARSLALLKEDGVDRATGVNIPPDATIALLVTLELPSGTTSDASFDQIGRALEGGAPDTPLVRFCRMLSAAGVLDDVAIAVPGDHARASQLLALREGVPAAVNQRVGRAKQNIDARIEKTAADMIVPFERLEWLLDLYDAEFARRGLDAAVWGHISDGNLHPNVIPRSLDDVNSGKQAILIFSREVVRAGGAPLAEHGVGRSRIKQQMLREMYGEAAINEMRGVKQAIDPAWKLAPGVLFSSRLNTEQ